MVISHSSEHFKFFLRLRKDALPRLLKQGSMFPWQSRKYKTFQSHVSSTDKTDKAKGEKNVKVYVWIKLV